MKVSVCSDDKRRRAFWTEQMDAASALMDKFRRYPVRECGEPLVSLRSVARAAGVALAFSRTKFMGTRPRLFYLRAGLIPGILAAAREMRARGWVLKIEDGYRTRAMQKQSGCAPRIFDLVLRRILWENGGQTPPPEFMLKRLTAVIATRPKIGTHMSGSALDISVLRADDGREVERGGPYLEISERTPMASPFVSGQARRNRAAITALMARHGFIAYPYEFWHYSQGDVYAELLRKTGRPGRYGAVDWDPQTGKTIALADPDALLNSLAEIRAALRRALQRQAN